MLAFILLALVACDPDSGKPGDPPGDSPANTGEPGDSDGHTGRPDDSDSDDEDTAEPEAAGTCPEGWETDTGAPPNPSWTSCETAPSPSGAAWSGWTTVRTHEILAYGPTLVADLNGDGVQELVDWGSEGAAADGTTVFVAGLSGDGALSTAWTIGPTNTPGAALAMATGDLSGDGQDDLIVLDTDGVRVWTWTSAGLAMTISTELIYWGTGD